MCVDMGLDFGEARISMNAEGTAEHFIYTMKNFVFASKRPVLLIIFNRNVEGWGRLGNVEQISRNITC